MPPDSSPTTATRGIGREVPKVRAGTFLEAPVCRAPSNRNVNEAAELAASDAIFLGLAIVLVLWVHRDGLRSGLAFGVGGLVALGLGSLISAAWYEPRPFVVEHLTPLIAHSADASFPSDHLLVLGALFGATVVSSRPIGLAALGLAVVVGLARVYVRVHYPWDVIGGFVIGTAAGGLAYWVCQWARPILTLLDRRLQQLHLRPVLFGRKPNRAANAAGSHGVQP